MKKIFVIFMLFIISITGYAEKDVVKFLGIPVDGSKKELEKRLIAKGFKKNLYEKNVLEGKFNGKDVFVGIGTNNDKVYRIGVIDQVPQNEENIKINFNKLLEQFKNNGRYIVLDDYRIPEKEDISYEMIVKNKCYEAVFYQMGTKEEVRKILLKKYTEKQIDNPNKKLKKEIDEYLFEIYSKKLVWFMIQNLNGEYNISIFYDNVYNQANGEDL